jgi:cytoskeletal protein RodZ
MIRNYPGIVKNTQPAKKGLSMFKMNLIMFTVVSVVCALLVFQIGLQVGNSIAPSNYTAVDAVQTTSSSAGGPPDPIVTVAPVQTTAAAQSAATTAATAKAATQTTAAAPAKVATTAAATAKAATTAKVIVTQAPKPVTKSS